MSEGNSEDPFQQATMNTGFIFQDTMESTWMVRGLVVESGMRRLQDVALVKTGTWA